MTAGERAGSHSRISGQRIGIKSTVMLIRTWGRIQGEPYGELLSYHSAGPIPFANMRELILKANEISKFQNSQDGMHLLQTSCSEKDERKRRFRKQHEETEGEGFLWEEDFHPEVRKSLEKFYLEIIGRRYESIQGRIRSKNSKGRNVYFHSALELMLLLSTARG